MKPPLARPVSVKPNENEASRTPKAFVPSAAVIENAQLDPENGNDLVAAPLRRMGWIGKTASAAASILVSAALGLTAERLVRDLFAANEWLGWLGLAALCVLLTAIVGFVVREVVALRRLRLLDALRNDAARATIDNDGKRAQQVATDLLNAYAGRPDLARARQAVSDNLDHMFDGSEIITLTERSLMAPLDARAKVLTAASARRVALVTAVSPRAIVDVAFVVWESVRLAGAVAALYGARPGLLGSWRLTGAVLTHLAVTGGLVLTDGLVEQLVGQGLAAKLSARLGEGVVNGLMTVRVGIAAMRVVRPLPFETQKQPTVRDFIPDLANLVGDAKV